MLEAMRQHSRSMIIYVLFGIIIAVFVLTFGPQSGGCVAGLSPAARIDGRNVSDLDFRYGYAFATMTIGGRDLPPEQSRLVRELIMDHLIEREIYAQAAEKLGFHIGADEVEHDVAQGKLVVLGEEMPKYLTSVFYDKDGVFDYELFKKRFVGSMGLTVRQFLQEEQREMLAQKMRDLLRGGLAVSPDEVKQSFVESHTTVTLATAQFSAKSYENQAQLSTSDIDLYLAAHKKELQAEFDAKKATAYTGLPRQVHLLQIFFAAPKDDAAKVKDATARAQAALARLQKGEPFGAVARSASDDDATRYHGEGGDAGWRRLADSGAAPEIEAAVGKLKEGATSPVVATDSGLYLFKAAGFRQGDLSFDSVARDLAEADLRSEKGRSMAKAAAGAVLARVQSGATLDAILPGGDAQAAPTSAPAHGAPGVPANGPSSADAALPKLVVGTPFTRQGATVPGIGDDAKLAHAIFDVMKKGDVSKTAYEHDDPAGGPSWYLYEVKDRQDASMDDFDKHQDTYAAAYLATKAAEVRQSWVQHECVALRDAGKITVTQSFLSADGAEEPAAAEYMPCRGAAMMGLQ